MDLSPFAVWGIMWSYYAFLYYIYLRTLKGFDQAMKEIEDARKINWRQKVEEFSSDHGKELPHFLITVPAYECMPTMRKSIRTIAYSDYQTNKFNIFLLTERREMVRNEKKRKEIVNTAYSLLTSQEPPPNGYRGEASLIIRHILDNYLRDSTGLSSLLAEKILRKRLDSKTIERAVGSTVIALQITGAFQGKHVNGEAARYVEDAKRILQDYERILGFEGYPGYTDTENFLKFVKELAGYADFEKQVSLRKIGRKAIRWIKHENFDASLFDALHSPSEIDRYVGERLADVRNEFLSMGNTFRDLLEKAYDETFITTVSEVEKEKDRINSQYPGLVKHLVLDDHPGFKPGALNLFLEHMDGKVKDPDNSHIVVFDGDSLPARWTLPLLAYNIISTEEKNPVFQIYVSAMANYYATRGKFIRGRATEIIPLSQTLGMTGRVRGLSVPHKEPDMDGGRGYSIPYNLIKKFGGWDIKTLCEDSRLLIVKIGLMDGRTKQLKYIPSFNLEEAPVSIASYIRQQKRWVEGIDDITEIITAPMSDMLFSSNLTQQEKPGVMGRIKLNIRKYKLAFTRGLIYLGWGLLPFGIPAYLAAGFLAPLDEPARTAMSVAAGALFGYGWFRHIRSLKSVEVYTPGGFNKRDKIKLTLLGLLTPLYITPVTYYMITHYLSKLNPRRVTEWIVTKKTEY